MEEHLQGIHWEDAGEALDQLVLCVVNIKLRQQSVIIDVVDEIPFVGADLSERGSGIEAVLRQE